MRGGGLKSGRSNADEGRAGGEGRRALERGDDRSKAEVTSLFAIL